MRTVLDRFCTFAGEFFRFCLFSASGGLGLTRRDRSFSPKSWTEGKELLLIIQALFARECTNTKCVNVLAEPCGY